jgi:peptide/nickel transport system permease protein
MSGMRGKEKNSGVITDAPARVTIKKRSQIKDIIRRFRKNKAAIVGFFILVCLVFCAFFPQLIAPYGYDDQDLGRRFISPNRQFVFGTDQFGRDIFSRVVYGCRTSLSIGLAAIAIACICGTILGCIAGYYGSVTDNVIMRFIDILLAIPNLMLAMSIVAALGISRFNLTVAIGVGATGGYARIVRASILSLKEQEFVEASRAIGASDSRIILKHLLPNCLAPIIVQVSTGIGAAIMAAAGMSFVGLGIAPPTPEWGAMLSSGRAYMRDYWYVVTFPGIAIMLTVFAFNLFGDGLRDALDPRLKN